jgi:hypothetical protein
MSKNKTEFVSQIFQEFKNIIRKRLKDFSFCAIEFDKFSFKTLFKTLKSFE